MRRDEDHFRHFMPIFRRIIILVAVLTAVPVMLWTITAFVRTYVGQPQTPTFRPITAATDAPVSAAAPVTVVEARATTTDARSPVVETNGTPQRVQPTAAAANTPTPDPTTTAAVTPASAGPAPAPVWPAAAPSSPTPAPAWPARSADNVVNLASAATPAPNPPANVVAQSDAQGPAAAPPAADALPPAAPISGPVPLPRQRPRLFAMAQTNVPLPRPRPESAGPAPETQASPLGWLQHIFQQNQQPVAGGESPH